MRFTLEPSFEKRSKTNEEMPETITMVDESLIQSSQYIPMLFKRCAQKDSPPIEL